MSQNAWLFALWLAMGWPAFAFRPRQLVITEASTPIGKRLVIAVLGLLWCFAIQTVIVLIVVFVIGVARGITAPT